MAKLEPASNNFKGLLPLIPTLTPIAPTKTPVKPDKGLLNGFVYTPAAKTNVRETWMRFGWKPINDNY